MKVSKTKLEIAVAKAGMTWKDLSKAAGLSCAVILQIKKGGGARPITVGKIARALGCDISDILESERQDGKI